MEILEELGKDRNVMEVAKLVAEIFREEKRMKEAYCQMGKLYAALHPKDYDSAFADCMEQLRQSESTIMDCQHQMLALHEAAATPAVEEAPVEEETPAVEETPVAEEMPAVQARRCANCNAELAEGVNFCTTCGTPVQQPEEAPAVEKTAILDETAVATQRRCANCNAELDEDMRFCINCGTPVQAAPVEAPRQRFCTGCGAQMPEDVAFCTACGKKMQ